MKLGDVFTEVCLGLYTLFKNSKAFYDSFFSTKWRFVIFEGAFRCPKNCLGPKISN